MSAFTYDVGVRTIICWKGKRGYRPELTISTKGQTRVFEGSILERKWQAEEEADRMYSRIDNYLSLIEEA